MTPAEKAAGAQHAMILANAAKKELTERLKKTAGAADPRLSRKATWPLRDIGSHLN